MTLNLTPVGILMCAAMAAWLVGIVLYALSTRGRHAAFVGGAVIALAAFVTRWAEVGHIPLQSLFEVFLTLSVLLWPLWWFCQKFLGARWPVSVLAVGVVLLFPTNFIFSQIPERLPPALYSPLFGPHVLAYMVSYTAIILAAVQSVLQLTKSQDSPSARQYEQASSRIVKLAFPLLTLGLILGAVWGKLCYGDYWNWDPKELWALATWVLAVAYLHLRGLYGNRFSKINAILVILVAVLVILTLVWISAAKIFNGYHTYSA